MNAYNYEQLCEVVLEVVGKELSRKESNANDIDCETDIMSFLDSFGILDAIVEIEEKTGLSTDLAKMDFDKAMTISGLASEIIRINYQ